MKTPRHGFTLIELLVVVALIALLSAGLGLALSGGNAGSRLRSAEATANGIFAAARAQAVLHQTETRVLVSVDPSDPDAYGRLMGVIYRDPEDATRWIATGRGNRLPEGVYFWEAKSVATGTMQLAYPRATSQSEGSGPTWQYFAFNHRGEAISEAGLDADLGRFILGAATWNRTERTTPLFEAATTPIGGFAIFPLGATAFPRHPEDLR